MTHGGDDLLFVVDVAPALGVTPEAVVKALRGAAGRGVRKVGRLNAVRLADLEWYAAKREHRSPVALTRPDGWLGLREVERRLNVTASTVTELCIAGSLSAVRVGRRYFYDPESVDVTRLTRAGIPPAWIALHELEVEHDWPDHTPAVTARRIGIEVKSFRLRKATNGTAKRNAIRRSDAPRLIEAMKPFSYPDRLRKSEVADVLGVSMWQIQRWTRDGLPFVTCRMGGRWYAPADLLAFFAARSPAHDGKAARLRAHLLKGESTCVETNPE